MPTAVEQNYTNHVRFDPSYHFFLLPGALVLLAISIWNMVRNGFTLESLWLLAASILLALIALKFRVYALKAQDRVIRLEERLRLRQLLPPERHLPVQYRQRQGKVAVGSARAARFTSSGSSRDFSRQTAQFN